MRSRYYTPFYKTPLKWIPRSKSGVSKSRPRWAAHTRIRNVWECPPPGGLRQEPHIVSCRNRAGHFQWVFPISRGLFSLLLGGLNISSSREQPGELQLGQPTFPMTLSENIVANVARPFSLLNFPPGLDSTQSFLLEKSLCVVWASGRSVRNDVSQARSFESKSPPFVGVRS